MKNPLTILAVILTSVILSSIVSFVVINEQAKKFGATVATTDTLETFRQQFNNLYNNQVSTTSIQTFTSLQKLFGNASTTIFSANYAQIGTTATTTLGNGTLTVPGLATLQGGATTTQITLLSGDTIKNTTASTIVVSGGLTTTGNVSVTNASATSTLSVGCIQATATSSATAIKIIFSTAGATSTYTGTAYWSYGTCP